MRQPAIIFDRDGTTASCFARPVDKTKQSWAAFNAALPFDAPVPAVVGIFHAIRPGVARLMTSGRAEGDWPGDRRRRFQMQDWNHKHGLDFDRLYMRVGGDFRPDDQVKEEILVNEILPHYDVVFAIDDRQSIVDLWRRYNIPVLQVTDPDIPPTIGT